MKENSKLHILIVEDEESIKLGLKELLESEGYRVTAVASAIKGLKLIKCGINLVITDHHMPEMTGLELLSEIKKIDPTFPVIVFSGTDDANTESKALKMGASGFIEKPFHAHELFSLIRRASPKIYNVKSKKDEGNQ